VVDHVGRVEVEEVEEGEDRERALVRERQVARHLLHLHRAVESAAVLSVGLLLDVLLEQNFLVALGVTHVQRHLCNTILS
jgi:hypothetical protein